MLHVYLDHVNLRLSFTILGRTKISHLTIPHEFKVDLMMWKRQGREVERIDAAHWCPEYPRGVLVSVAMVCDHLVEYNHLIAAYMNEVTCANT